LHLFPYLSTLLFYLELLFFLGQHVLNSIYSTSRLGLVVAQYTC
jgi:hypothetical protein